MKQHLKLTIIRDKNRAKNKSGAVKFQNFG